MNAASSVQPAAGYGIVDASGRLIEADAPLLELHERAGGEEGGVLAIPQVAAIARLARRLQAPIAQTALAADGDRDLEIVVRAEPSGNNVRLSLEKWVELPKQGLSSSVDLSTDLERASSDWTWAADAELRLTRLSPVAAGLVGAAVADLMGKPLTSLFRLREREDGSLPILVALAQRKPFGDQIAELRCGKGDRLILAGRPVLGQSGELVGLDGSAILLSGIEHVPGSTEPAGTHVAAFGEKLDQALRGPLAQIIEEAEALARQQAGPLGPSYSEYAADINSAARHLLSLVDDLGMAEAAGRGEAASIGDIDLASAAREAVSLLRRQAGEKGVTLIVQSEGELHARGDYRRALQIIVNLITNAIRYSPEASEVLVELGAHRGQVSVSVADKGKGIHPSDQNRIFEKFERLDPTEPGGTGLGLFTSRELARAMGGDIQVASQQGEGSRFTLVLPRAT